MAQPLPLSRSTSRVGGGSTYFTRPNFMSADFTINPDQKFVFSFGWDTLTFDDVINHRRRLAEDPQFRLDYRQIIDITQVASVKLSNSEIQSLAGQRVFAPESRRALVTASSLQFGLSRVFQAYSQAQNIHIFNGLKDAVEWVGVPMEAASKAINELRSKHDLA
jgi:hypothetical protein